MKIYLVTVGREVDSAFVIESDAICRANELMHQGSVKVSSTELYGSELNAVLSPGEVSSSVAGRSSHCTKFRKW